MKDDDNKIITRVTVLSANSADALSSKICAAIKKQLDDGLQSRLGDVSCSLAISPNGNEFSLFSCLLEGFYYDEKKNNAPKSALKSNRFRKLVSK